MNKCLLLTLVAWSGSILAQDESYVLPIEYTNGYKMTRDWTNADPSTRELKIIQDNLPSTCIRRVGRNAPLENVPLWDQPSASQRRKNRAAIRNLPVAEATKAIIAQKLQMNADLQDELVYYSDCCTDAYNGFARHNMATMRARTANKQDIEKAQTESNIISEISMQIIHDDACDGALDALISHKKALEKMTFKYATELHDKKTLKPYCRRFARWHYAPSKDVVYTDNYHDQSEKED